MSMLVWFLRTNPWRQGSFRHRGRLQPAMPSSREKYWISVAEVLDRVYRYIYIYSLSWFEHASIINIIVSWSGYHVCKDGLGCVPFHCGTGLWFWCSLQRQCHCFEPQCFGTYLPACLLQDRRPQFMIRFAPCWKQAVKGSHGFSALLKHVPWSNFGFSLPMLGMV